MYPSIPVEESFGLDLVKVGKMTKAWVTRHYVLRNYTMYIFDKKTDLNPKHVVYLRGLYFKRIYDRGNMHGLLLYSESDRFKQRRMYHRDEQTMDLWMRQLNRHCQSFSPADAYEQISRIGGGKFADVFDSRHKITGKVCAVKKINKAKLNHKEKQFLRSELQIISMIAHPNVVEMQSFYETSKWIYIVMECVRGGELFHFLETVDLTEEEIAHMMK